MEVVSKSETTSEKSPATFEVLNTYFDIRFENLNDYIEYKIILYNKSSTNYNILEKTQFSSNRHIKYSFYLDGEDDIIKEKSSRTGYL